MNAQTDDMNDKWLNDLRDRMADYREPAPENLWDDIARELKRAAASAVPRRNAVALWVRRSAVAAALAVALTLGYRRLSHDVAPAPDLMASATGPEVVDDAPALVAEASDAVSPETAERGMIAFARRTSQPRHDAGGAFMPETAIPAAEMRADEASADDAVNTADNAKNKSVKHSDPDTNDRRKARNDTPETAARHRRTYAANVPTGKTAKGKLTADIYLSGLAGSSDSHHSANGSVMVSADRYRHVAEHADPLADPLTVVMLYNRNAPVDTEIKHRSPLKFGFSLRRMITPSIGIESGLTYTLLASSLSSGGEECYYDEDRTLHYMGIPVNLVWNVWSGKRLSFYLSGGASVEKCIAGHAKTRYVLRGHDESHERRSIGVDPLQWSVAAAAGLQFDISPRTGFYVEPGVGYYFDNGSDTETVYSKRPFNFNLNMGIRISFR